MARITLTNVSILDGSGAAPFIGEVAIEDDLIASVSQKVYSDSLAGGDKIDCKGATLMSGLCDAHTHFSWTNMPDLDSIGKLPVEEHVLATAANAKTYLDCGYTMCVGAAAAKPRLDVVIRNAINQGQIPGPRYLANGPEITTIGGLGDMNPSHVASYTFVEIINGPEEMRRTVRRLIKEGVDQIKLNLSGEEITNVRAEETPMALDEIAMAVTEAHNRGKRICAHARSAESVKICVRQGIEIIYHASFADEEALDMLEANRDHHFVAPALAWLIQTCEGASPWGITPEVARKMGYERELEAAIGTMQKMHKRGIRVLPGGDYGFAWTPHGTYAKDLEYFVKRIGMTPMETLIAATRLGGEIMLQPKSLGQIKAGFQADLILVDGDPLADITVLQNRERILGVMKAGKFHKRPSFVHNS